MKPAEYPTAEPFLPAKISLPTLQADLRGVKREMDRIKGRGKTARQAARGIAEHPGKNTREQAKPTRPRGSRQQSKLASPTHGS